jgi:hypothetical protein
MGYKLFGTWFGYKICLINGKKINNFKWTYPALDVFVMKNDINNEIQYKYRLAETTFKKCKYNYSEVFPLKRYKFANFYVTGPNNGHLYLNRCYGNNWNSVGYMEYDHQNERAIKKIKVKLSSKNKEPAIPFITL